MNKKAIFYNTFSGSVKKAVFQSVTVPLVAIAVFSTPFAAFMEVAGVPDLSGDGVAYAQSSGRNSGSDRDALRGLRDLLNGNSNNGNNGRGDGNGGSGNNNENRNNSSNSRNSQTNQNDRNNQQSQNTRTPVRSDIAPLTATSGPAYIYDSNVSIYQYLNPTSKGDENPTKAAAPVVRRANPAAGIGLRNPNSAAGIVDIFHPSDEYAGGLSPQATASATLGAASVGLLGAIMAAGKFALFG